MTIIYCLILFSVFKFGSLEEFDRENDVLILTNDNFDDIISKYQPIFIDFYAPWCKFSQRLQPQFEKVAQDFEKQKIKIHLAKVDVSVETELAERFNIKEYPTLILFKENRQIKYTKGHHHNLLSEWLFSKVDNFLSHIDSTDVLNKMKEKHSVLVIIDKSLLSNVVIETMEKIDDVQLATMESPLFSSLYSVYKKVPLVLLRKIDNALLLLEDELNEKNLETFIKKNEVPSVIKYTFQLGGKVFTNPYRYMHLMVFMDDKFDEVDKELNEAAQNHPEISFIMIDINDNTTTSLINFFNVDITKLPFYLLSDAKYKKRFLPHSQDIIGKKINQFLTDVKEGKIEQHLKSQPIPEDWNKNPVKVLVSKNFEEVVYDKSKVVFVEFYAPWCNYCMQLEPIWEKLAKELINVPDLVITKIDKTENDIKNIEIKSFPTLKLFLKNTNEVVNYSGARTKERLKEFLSKYVDLSSIKKEEL